MSSGQWIGFPPGLLSERPLRLPVLFNREDVLALWKPARLLAQAHPWYANQRSLEEAVFRQIQDGKAELIHDLGLNWLQVIHPIDPEVEGPILMARNPDFARLWRNAVGSGQVRFTFQFISRTPGENEAREHLCDLPIAAHFQNKKAYISHRQGKQSRTLFRWVEAVGPVSLWEAVSHYPRLQQIRLHAFESGIPLWGDPLFPVDVETLLPPGVRFPARLGGAFPFLLHQIQTEDPFPAEALNLEQTWSKSNQGFLRLFRRLALR